MLRTTPEHTLVIGPPKSGSSAVFSAIGAGQRRVGRDPWSLFEPRNQDRIDNVILGAPDRPLLVKALTGAADTVIGNVPMFGKRVMTVRDPRDLLISFLLFKPLTTAAIDRTSQADVDAFVELLRRKEADPGSLSVRALCRRSKQLGIGAPPIGKLNGYAKAQQRFLRKYPAHVLRYEQFAVSDTEALSDYLGYPVVNETIAASSRYGHIARSGRSGDFANWFLPSDLEYYNGCFAEFLKGFGYPSDVELIADPVIDPSRSSEYVHSRSRLRRSSRTSMVASRGEHWRPSDAASQDDLDRLKDYGLNGDPTACLRVAQVLRSGHLGVASPQDVLHWAHSAAELGSSAGMKLVAELLASDAGTDPARNLEVRRWQARYRLHPAVVRNEERQRVQSSMRYWAGSAVVEAIRRPRTIPPSIREGVKRWKRRSQRRAA